MQRLEYQANVLSVRIVNPDVTRILHKKCTRICHFQTKKNSRNPPIPTPFSTPYLKMKLRLRLWVHHQNEKSWLRPCRPFSPIPNVPFPPFPALALTQSSGLDSAVSSTAAPGRAWLTNGFWCMLSWKSLSRDSTVAEAFTQSDNEISKRKKKSCQ